MELIVGIAFIHLIACLSPGPDIFLVVLNSLRHGWRVGVATTFGILSGVSLHIILGISGISYLLTQGPLLRGLIPAAGGGWLVYLGLKGLLQSLRKPATPLAAEAAPGAGLSGGRAWLEGLMVNLLNPKALLFFLSLFSVMIGPDVTLSLRILAGAVMILVQALAFSLVAFLIDRPFLKKRWIPLQTWLERGVSALLLLLGLGIWFKPLLARTGL
ncbi:MAG: LysE family transporter [Oceanipulchritudo sp.]